METIKNEQLEALQTTAYDHATHILLSDLIHNMAFSLHKKLDLRRTTKLKRILRPQADTRQDTSRSPATSNSLPINNKENIFQNNIIEADDATSINPDFHTKQTPVTLPIG